MTKQELQELVSECVKEELQVAQEADRIFAECGEEIIKESIVYSFYEENDMIAEEEALEEGANLDMRAAYKAGLVEAKAAVKEAKKAVKAKDKKAAKEALNKAKKAADKMEKEVRGIESTAGSAILGYFATGYIQLGKLLIPLAVSIAGGAVTSAGLLNGNEKMVKTGSTVSAVGSGVAYVKSLVVGIKELITFVKELDNKDAKAADKFNRYKNLLIGNINTFKKSIDKIEKKIEKLD